MYNLNQNHFPQNNGYFPILYKKSLINEAAREAGLITQASEPMTYLAALGAASLALQGLIDVELPVIDKKCPVALMILTVADSGERKSSVERLFSVGYKKFQKKKEQEYKVNLERYRIHLELHNKKESLIKKTFDINSEEGCELMVDELTSHQRNAPVRPAFPKLTYEDSTYEALVAGLKDNSPNGYLVSSEGGLILNSPIMQKTAILNALYSDGMVIIDRKNGESFALEGVRLTVNVMVQPSALDKYLKKSKDDVRGNGLLARLLFCAPNSTCGYREIKGINFSRAKLNSFNDRVQELLSDTFKLNKHTDRVVVRFSDEAKVVWVDNANDIERKMQPNQVYFNAKDHASKLAENIARLAAVIHYFDNPLSEEISVESLRDAIHLVSYFSGQFMVAFNPLPQHIVDANNLGVWISRYINSGGRYIKKNDLLQFSPKATRKKIHLNAALACFLESRTAIELRIGRTMVIDLLPQYAPNQAQLEFDCPDLNFKNSKNNIDILST